MGRQKPASSMLDMVLLGKLMLEHGPKLLAMLRRRIDPALAVGVAPNRRPC